MGQTADVSIGDAWLDEYINDYKNSNIIITRNKVIDEIIKKGTYNNRLRLDPISKDKVIESQAGGIRHRREGLSYRLYLKEIKSQWVHEKRIKPIMIRSKKRRMIYALREKISEKSHYFFLEAKNQADLEVFKSKIGLLISDCRKINRPFWKRISRIFKKIMFFCKNLIKVIIKKLGLLEPVKRLIRKN